MADYQDTGRELRQIVRINEEIKSVVATAFKINLMAMNAIFLAKRAGQSALGFGVLSNELRRFAMELQKQMSALREMTYGSVSTVTAMVKQVRINRVLDRARREASGTGKALIEEYLSRRRMSAYSQHQEQIAAVGRRLAQMIADTAQLVELGSVLARSAKIEAAYGGAFSSSLMQVSSDFEQTIGAIQRSLENLNRQHLQDSRP